MNTNRPAAVYGSFDTTHCHYYIDGEYHNHGRYVYGDGVARDDVIEVPARPAKLFKVLNAVLEPVNSMGRRARTSISIYCEELT